MVGGKGRILRMFALCILFMVGVSLYCQNQMMGCEVVKRAVPLEEAFQIAREKEWHLLKVRDFGWIEYEFYDDSSRGRKGELVELVHEGYPEKKGEFPGLLPYAGDNLKYPLLQDGNLILIKSERSELVF